MKRLLYAEDDTDTREATTMFLERHGWEVVVAADGRDALLKYHLQPHGQFFDALLLDVNLTRLNGLAVGLNVRTIERYSEDGVPRARHVYLTGFDTSIPVSALKAAAEADVYLTKPVRSEELLAALNG